MKRIRGSVDLKDWDLDSIEELNETIKEFVLKAASEIVTLTFDDDETYMYLPFFHKEDDEDFDVLTLELMLSMNAKGDHPIYRVAFRELLEDLLLSFCDKNNKVDDKYFPYIMDVKNSLLQLLGIVEKFLPEETKDDAAK